MQKTTTQFEIGDKGWIPYIDWDQGKLTIVEVEVARKSITNDSITYDVGVNEKPLFITINERLLFKSVDLVCTFFKSELPTIEYIENKEYRNDY